MRLVMKFHGKGILHDISDFYFFVVFGGEFFDWDDVEVVLVLELVFDLLAFLLFSPFLRRFGLLDRLSAPVELPRPPDLDLAIREQVRFQLVEVPQVVV